MALLAVVFLGGISLPSSTTSNNSPTPVPMPMLTDVQAMMVVITHMAQESSLVRAVGAKSQFAGCIPPEYEPMGVNSKGEQMPHDVSYQNNGKWTVQFGICLFIVDDYTGQVTGP